MVMNLGAGKCHYVCACLLGALLSLANASPDPAVGNQGAPQAIGSSMPRNLVDVDEALKRRPDDRQLLLSKGLLLMDSAPRADAIRFHEQLVKQHPDFLEAYNNLAYLQAASGDVSKARQTLENGLRSHPGYYALFSNLTRIHASEASVAYRRALQVGGGSTESLQLSLIKPDRSVQTRFAPVTSSPAVTAPVATPGSQATQPKPDAKLSTPAPPVSSASAPPTSSQNPAATTPPQEAVVRQAVLSWARAWSDKDFKRYLQAYDPEFSPPGKMSRREWERERESRIVKRKKIEVKVNGLEVQVKGQRAVATFRQSYSSDGVKAVTRKRLELVWRGGEWRILKEQA